MGKTCFFITPIGEEKSPERKQSDFLMKYTLKYVCEKFDMELIRTDKLRGASDINDDIIELVHTADICVADLTGLNPNVMFEVGMRIETKRPLIIIAKEGTKLPFDVHSYRTIYFDKIEQAVNNTYLMNMLSEYFEVCEKDGYAYDKRATLSNIYQKILEIHNAVSTAPINANADLNSLTDFDMNAELLMSSLGPSEAFQYAYKTNNIQAAEKILDCLSNQPQQYYRNKVCALATLGSIKAVEILEELLPEVIEEKNFDNSIELLGSLITGYMRNDIEKQKIKVVNPNFNKILKLAANDVQKASVYNQKQRITAGAGDYETAIKYAKQTIELCDDEPAYFYNYAAILYEMGNLDEAKAQIKQCVEIADLKDEPHEEGLFLACKLFKHSESADDRKYFADCYTKLKQENPLKAKLVNFE